MNRIDQIFANLRPEGRPRGRRALMPFITAGDPDVATTEALLPALERAGASVCEIGFPFSDPIADGPVIQASMTYALDHGVRVREILEAVARARPKTGLGLVAMVSYSIVHKLGPQAFIRDAKAAGFDGFIVPDLPLEQSAEFRGQTAAAGLILSMLISPTTPIERAEGIARASSGFVYLLARAGLTGERTSLPADLGERIQRLRRVTDLPIAVGFGVSTPEQVGQVVSAADAAIVGAAIVRRIAQQRAAGQAAVVAEIEKFVGELAEGLGKTSA